MKTKTILLRNAKEIYDGKFYQTSGAAGFDLRYIGNEPIVIHSRENKLVPTGLQMEIPDGFYLAIHPRSGLAVKHNITLGNAVGVVDSDYRGEIQAIIYNAGNNDFVINEGDRIAQAVLMKHGGFGSTGAK
jgi:dUTP pyrophosphatase